MGQSATSDQTGADSEAVGFEQLLADAPQLPLAAIAAIAFEQGERDDAPEEDAAAPDATAVEDLLAVLMAATAPARPQDKAVPATADAAADAPLPQPAAPKPAAAQTMAAVLVAEPQAAARPADGGAAMTVLFTQAAGDGATGVGEAAKPAAVQTRMLDMSNDDVWIEQLARDIVAAKSDSGDISFRLMPRHLGRLDVAMRLEEGGVALQLDTQHEATAKIVTAAQTRLVDDLRQQGIRVAGAEVTCTPGETGRHQQQQGQNRASSTPDTAHLIETATEAEPREENRPADRRGRFA
jgi:flagellar hook-length control protein FliK